MIYTDPPPPPPYVVIAAVITATVSLIAAFMGWIKDRNNVARRSQIIDEATKYLAFWTMVRDAEQTTTDEAKKVRVTAEYEKRLIVAKRLVDLKATHLPRTDFAQYDKWKRLVYFAACGLFTTSLILFLAHLVQLVGTPNAGAAAANVLTDPEYVRAGIFSIAAGFLVLGWIAFKVYRSRLTPRLTIDQWIENQKASGAAKVEPSEV